MAKVKLLVGLAGPRVVCKPGDEWECGSEEAARLVAAGMAEHIEEKKRKAIKPKPPERREVD